LPAVAMIVIIKFMNQKSFRIMDELVALSQKMSILGY